MLCPSQVGPVVKDDHRNAPVLHARDGPKAGLLEGANGRRVLGPQPCADALALLASAVLDDPLTAQKRRLASVNQDRHVDLIPMGRGALHDIGECSGAHYPSDHAHRAGRAVRASQIAAGRRLDANDPRSALTSHLRRVSFPWKHVKFSRDYMRMASSTHSTPIPSTMPAHAPTGIWPCEEADTSAPDQILADPAIAGRRGHRQRRQSAYLVKD